MTSITQRQELHKGIWKIANDLRGSADGWDFKNYVLGFLFYRFICENLIDYISKNNSGNEDYTNLDDKKAINGRATLIEAKGFFILPSHLFSNVLKQASCDEAYLQNLNEHLKDAFDSIQKSSQDAKNNKAQQNLKDLFDVIDLNSKNLGASVIERNKKILKIMHSINGIDFNYSDSNIDAFGDAYEYLMTMYASNAGKSGGEFFTPQEVSELLVRLTLDNYAEPNKIYDPACGSGSLLLQYKKILAKDPPLGYFGQELNITSYNLARMNMFLHNVNYTRFNIACGDTLLNPLHKDAEPFDAIVSNPPYSTKWEGKDNPLLINDARFSPAGVLAPKSAADFAFIMHSLSWLSSRGAAAIVIFPGVLYRTGAEAKIRQYLITQNYIDCIIALPKNLFFGTQIDTCILVLKKNKKDTQVLFINAQKEFKEAKKQNILTQENINNILNLYKSRQDIAHISRLVSTQEIESNAYNLSVSTYIEPEYTKEVIDINVLNQEIAQIVESQGRLRDELDSIIAEIDIR